MSVDDLVNEDFIFEILTENGREIKLTFEWVLKNIFEIEWIDQRPEIILHGQNVKIFKISEPPMFTSKIPEFSSLLQKFINLLKNFPLGISCSLHSIKIQNLVHVNKSQPQQWLNFLLLNNHYARKKN